MSFDYKRALKREFNVGSKEQRIRYGAGIGLVLVVRSLELLLLLISILP